MKDKISILHERALMTCVVMLFVCIIFKLFGVQWFNLDTNIPALQEIDRIIMSSVPLSFLYSYIMYSINLSFYIYMASKDKKHAFDILIRSCGFIIMIIFIKTYIDNSLQVFLLESLILWIIVLISCNFKFVYSVKIFLLCHMLTLVYQLISIFLRSLTISVCDYSITSTLLLSLDYYILLLITYLYKERRCKNV